MFLSEGSTNLATQGSEKSVLLTSKGECAVPFILSTVMCCSERRRLRKAQQVEEKKQQKEQLQENAGAKTATAQSKDHEEVDPRVFYENRCKFVDGLRKQNLAYPHKFNVCIIICP